MRYFPLFLDLADAAVLVTGGTEKAAQKLRLLTRTPARIDVVATTTSQEVDALARDGRITLHRRDFLLSDLDGKALVYAAGDDAGYNACIAEAARARSIPVNVVDAPADSSFITPAIVDRAPVVVAIGTEGTAPVLAREIKSRLEAWLPVNYGRIADAARTLRSRVARDVASPEQRRRVWERLLSGPFRHHVLAGNEPAAATEADNTIATAATAPPEGLVTLIGCGPGDPELLTLKAQQRLQEADVLVIDRLVGDGVLEYARRDATRIFVGKTPGGTSTSQDEINRILVREALQGRRVARLKGGDAFVFGRAAEEMATLGAAGIRVEIVPGITAAHACAASIGLPLTLRDKIRAFTLVTGGTSAGEPDLDWQALAATGQAFAVYMGVRTAADIRRHLLAAGADTARPVVIVENGTRPEERVIATTLDRLPDTIARKAITGPAILFVGLDWRDAHLTPPRRLEIDTGTAESAAFGDTRHRVWTTEETARGTHWVAG